MAAKKKASKPKSTKQRRMVAALGTRPTGGQDYSSFEADEELLPSGGAFGRCGGREITNRIEQRVCDLLQSTGVAHVHSPRYFEVRLGEKVVGAYSPKIVVRGRGREGKTVVLESIVAKDDEQLPKIVAFRNQYGAEFYVVLVADEDVLDEISIRSYDESTTVNDLATFVGRLAD